MQRLLTICMRRGALSLAVLLQEVQERRFKKQTQESERRCSMRVVDLPRDTWLVVEPLAAGEVALLSTHATQRQAEAERDKRNSGLARHATAPSRRWPRPRVRKAAAPC